MKIHVILKFKILLVTMQYDTVEIENWLYFRFVLKEM